MIALSPPALPLLRYFAPDATLVLADQADEPVSAQRFLVLARRLAPQLPPGRYVVNLCDDRYFFLLGFAAALIAGRTTLMPPSRAVAAIAKVRQDYPDHAVVGDEWVAAALRAATTYTGETVSGLAAQADAVPHIPADQLAAILFTSGSSGTPVAHAKTWSMLVQGAQQLQQAFGVAPGCCILGTVAPQHMFGLESTVVFPLQFGCAVHRARPLLPADIEHAIHASKMPVWLMTTPLHLRALVGEGHALRKVAGAISATMPLDGAGAAAAERILQAPLHEIYGCTEAGIVATRRTALQAQWQLCPDLQLRADGEHYWLHGERVAQPFALTDRVEMHADDRFSLLGRTGNMLKIAGKRSSLEALNAALLEIDGVTDGCFYQPAGKHDGQRLQAFVVAPQLTAAQVGAALRRRIDAVFMPRPLTMVARLPRDGNGKLPQAELEKLAANAADDSFHRRNSRIVAADHPALNGHFPGKPIVPGVWLLSEVMLLASARRRVAGIRQVKFHAPLSPDQAYEIALEEPASATLKFKIQSGAVVIASGVLQLFSEDGDV